MDTRARAMFGELFFHAIYITLLLVICYGNLDQNNFRQTETLKGVFPKIEKVIDFSSMRTLLFLDIAGKANK